MNINSHLLGDILMQMGFISKDQLDEAIKYQQQFAPDIVAELDFDRAELISKNRIKRNGDIPMLGQILKEKGFIENNQLEPALEIQDRQAKNLFQLSNDKLATALKTGFIINSTIDIVEVLSLIMKYANILTDATSSTLMLLDEKTNELVFSVPTGPSSEKLKDIRIPSGVGVAGWVLENQQYALVSDTQKDDRFYSQIDDLSGFKSQSLLAVPMRSQRRRIGVLEVINKNNGDCFNEEDALVLSIFSNHAAIAIENAMLLKTIQNRMEKEKKIEKKIAQSEKIRSIGTLAHGIAHDFNNILSPILGHTEIMLGEIEKHPHLKDNLDQIYTASIRAKELIRQILSYSRQERNEFRLIKLQHAIKEALKLIRATLPSTIEISQDINRNCAPVKADATQIHQIMMNLATNAYHAMEKNGGKINVTLKEVEFKTPNPAVQEDLKPGVYACLTVSDTGTGMDKDLTKKIFAPFFTTKQKGKGTGMGLSVVHNIAKNMNGTVQVFSELGKGTEFKFHFPVEKNEQ